MEYQHDDEGDPHKTTESKPLETKRTVRMLHESSFATSAFTSSRSQSRPPGFVSSSLDYKSSATDSTVAPAVTTKPGNKKNSNKKQQEQLERERQYQQQRRYRSGHPTRAQGNFGPPPHSVRSLEDLENMTEEQIYKLFMDDPELHQAFIKATEKEHKGNNAPTSAPVGAQKGRSSSRRKTSSSSKSKRSSSNSKKVKHEDAEREFPYFQWSLLLFLILAAFYKFYKSNSIPASTNELGRSSRNRTGKKQKKKHGGTGKKPSTKKSAVEQTTKPTLHRDGLETVEKKLPLKSRKKKKPSKVRSTTLSSTITNEEKESIPTRKPDRQNEPDLEFTDASSGNNEPETAKLDLVIRAESAMATSENDEEWQTVTKSSKGEKKRKTTTDAIFVKEKKVLEQPVAEPIVENEILEQPVVEKNISTESGVDNPGEADIEFDPVEETNEQPSEVSDADSEKIKKPATLNDEKEITDVAQPETPAENDAVQAVNKKREASETKNIEKPSIDSKVESVTTIEDDAALALQIHEEEVSLVRTANPQEEAWEEVTVKKKKGNRI